MKNQGFGERTFMACGDGKATSVMLHLSPVDAQDGYALNPRATSATGSCMLTASVREY